MATAGYQGCCIPGPWGRGAAIWGRRSGEALFQTLELTWTLIESDGESTRALEQGREQARLLTQAGEGAERLPGHAKGAMASAGLQDDPLAL